MSGVLAEVDAARAELDRALVHLASVARIHGSTSTDTSIAATDASRAAAALANALRKFATGEFSGTREVVVERPGRRRELADYLREERRRR